MKTGLTIRTKITISIFLVTSLVLAAAIIIIEARNEETVNALGSRISEQGEKVVYSFFEEQKEEALTIARRYANDPDLKEAFFSSDRDRLEAVAAPVFKTLFQNSGVTVFEFGDPDGIVYLRAHNPGKSGDDKSSNPVVKNVLDGWQVAGFVFGKNGLAIRGIVPIKKRGKVAGTFQAGFNINQSMLEKISTLVGDIAVYEEDVLVQSTYSQEASMIDSHRETDIYNRLENGQEEVFVHKNGVVTMYLPMLDPVNNTVQGMFRIDQDLGFISRRKNETRLLLLVVLGVAVILTLLVSRLIASGISRPIKRVTAMLKSISRGEGDLTRRLEVSTSDEIGEMAELFNLTMEKIKSLVMIVKKQSLNIQDVGVTLSSNMTEAAAAVNEISASIQNLKNQSQNQSVIVTQSSAIMKQITNGIDSLNQLIETQSANVSESSSAIEEMAASIHSVTQTLSANVENIEGLKEASLSGRSDIDKIAKDIHTVASESEELLKISNIIQKIASQTNLLAMNAAIEAAHAGESGKGFAVVAEEVRNLAESSRSQAEIVSKILKVINKSIESTVASTGSVLGKFENIESEVKTVFEQEQSIRDAMEEQTAGNKQVLEAIGQLNNITQEVKSSSDEMQAGSRQVITETEKLAIVTQENVNGMNEMAAAAGQVSVSVNKVNEMSDSNKASIEALIHEVNKFKVD